MMEERGYRTYGNTALAYREGGRDGGRGIVIDYDIARRSYEARKRLARRRQAAHPAVGMRGAQVPARASRRSMTVQEVLEASYRPNRGISEAVSDALSRIAAAIAGHPLTGQLRKGVLAGKATGKASHRQVLVSGTICMVLAAAIVFVGA